MCLRSSAQFISEQTLSYFYDLLLLAFVTISNHSVSVPLQFNCLGDAMKIKTLILCIHAERSEAFSINIMKTLTMKKAKRCSVTMILTV